MNKKLLLVGLPAMMLLASCSGSSLGGINPVSKQVDFKDIVTKSSELTLLRDQVVEGFNYLSSFKTNGTMYMKRFDATGVSQKLLEEADMGVEFFSNGYVSNQNYKEKYNDSTLDAGTSSTKTAVTDKGVYTVEEYSDSVFNYVYREDFDSEKGENKQSQLLNQRKAIGQVMLGINSFFGQKNRNSNFEYVHSVVGKISDTKIGGYYEEKHTTVFNVDPSDAPTYTQTESYYSYMEAELVGDVYQITTFESKSQLTGNIYGNVDRESISYVKLNEYEVLEETNTTYEIKYNKDMSAFTESSDLKTLATNFPSWALTEAKVVADVYLPVINPETKEIVDVDPVGSYEFEAIKCGDDMHSFVSSMTNCDPTYLVRFSVVGEAKVYNEEKGLFESKLFGEDVDLTNGDSYVGATIDDVKYYKGNINKVYNFSVKLAYDKEAEKGKEFSVTEFKIA